MAFTLLVNNIQYAVDVEPDTPLLWVLRDSIGLTGTKYGCGIGQCGACTVMVKGVAVRSCSLPVSRAIGTPITTIEGLSADGAHPVQLAWKEFDVPQCGYCQSGPILAAAALPAANAVMKEVHRAWAIGASVFAGSSCMAAVITYAVYWLLGHPATTVS